MMMMIIIKLDIMDDTLQYYKIRPKPSEATLTFLYAHILSYKTHVNNIALCHTHI